VQVFHLPKLGKLVGHILFRGFLVYIGDEDDSALDDYEHMHRAARVSTSFTWEVSTRS
jgi:hypothetical protein